MTFRSAKIVFHSTAVLVLTLFSVAGCSARLTNAKENSKSDSDPTYYIAADEVDWNYAPAGIDKMMGMPFMGDGKTFTERGPHRIGTVYRKALYREYTDVSFSTVKPRTADSEYLGMLGPTIRAEVGQTIRIVFKNNASKPYSMHPHGVFYGKDSEGAPYADGTSGADREDDAVSPGQTHVYTWQVPERAGPGPKDPSSVVWLYHSHANEVKDVASGLVGTIIITARGMRGPDGKPKDVDKEFINLFMMVNENSSWYLDHNIQTYTTDPKGAKKPELPPPDADFSINGPPSFIGSNFKFSINGYLYANMPIMTMKKGERVRWYLVTVGEGQLHTPHWHGNVVLDSGKRTDVISLSSAQMETVDMVPDDVGTWMYHCHFDEHMAAGMVALYKVEP
jgi:FtsP/CotA-like multicopper oxidase with cupredoxin domain